MSANGTDDEIPGREIAYRLLATEYDDASLSYAESDEERAPNYVISPTGARLNRVFAVGTLTEVTSVNDEMVRARIVDPTGAFVVYAGQYQPDELAFLEQVEPPAFVAVTGKARTFQPDDSDRVYTSIRPESIATVDADTRDRWVVSAAEQTLERIGTYASAARIDGPDDALTDALLEAGVESGFAAGIPLARDHYGTTPSYLAALRERALEACEVIADERDQVSGVDVLPGDTNPESDATFVALAELADVGLDELDVHDEPDSELAATSGRVTAAASPEAESTSANAHPGSAAGTATGTGTDAAGAETQSTTGESAAETLEGTDAEPETDEGDTPPAERSEPEAESPASTADSDTTGTETEIAVDDETAAVGETGEDGDLGDFDAGDVDVDDGMYEMDDEERDQLEAEFGTEFTTGSEVDDPGQADIDTPDSDEASTDRSATDDLGAPPQSGLEDAVADAPTDPEEPESAETAADAPDEPDTDETAAPAEVDSAAGVELADETADEPADDEPAADVDLESYVVETMAELDDGDGAARGTVIETVAADTGASTDEVEDAIQDALMGGQCYEPDDETLKAI